MKNIAVIVCLVLGLWGCGTKQADNSLVLNFEGRSIDIDYFNKVTAVYHDESHLNKFLLDRKIKVLSTTLVL